jgi:transcriptional regulator with XRE-family HTH domain
MTLQEIRQRKQELGYSNETLARISGLPLGTVQKVLAGVTKSPRYKTLKAIEGALYGNDIMPETLMVCDSRRDGSDDVPESEKQGTDGTEGSGGFTDQYPGMG